MLPGSTAFDYLALAEASRLLSAERLAPYRSLVDRGEPGLTIANRLVRDGLLTPFQAKVLLKGRTQGFFLTPKYKILEHLGTGGMGRVYLCEHLILQRLVAVKVLGVGTPSEGGPLSLGVIERFYREARADYLCAYSPDWVAKAGKGTNVKWPVGKGAPKSEGVTDAVNSTIGAIGYVELSHALQLNLRYGLVKNRQGTVVPPTFENVTAAAASLGDSIPKDLIFSLVDRREGKGAEKAYPITGATWALLPIPKEGKIDPNVVDFLEWATHEGQKYATDLRYAPLPKNFSDKLDAAFYRLKRGEEP